MSGGTRRRLSHSEAATEAEGEQLSQALGPGSVVLLEGQLGAGKTAFVRGLARGLGIDPDDVSSPTFGLVHEYRGGRIPLFHVDLYRLPHGGADDLGLEELGGGEGVVAIEWPDRLSRRPTDALEVRIERTQAVATDERLIVVGLPPA